MNILMDHNDETAVAVVPDDMPLEKAVELYLKHIKAWDQKDYYADDIESTPVKFISGEEFVRQKLYNDKHEGFSLVTVPLLESEK